MKLIVQPDEKNLSLFDFLQIKFCDKNFSKRKVKGIIDAGYCFVRGRPERFYRTKLSVGDEVRLRIPKHNQNEHNRISILFEDEEFVAIDKPAFITCDDRLVRTLHKEHGPLYLVHRLDKETTGVLLLAKTRQASDVLMQLFEERKVQKRYIALVDGVIAEHGHIENFLAPIERRQGFVKWGQIKQGQPSNGFWASTSFSRLLMQKAASLVSLDPKTGRTHQLRVHLAALKHPILGDFVYGQTFQCRHTPSRHLLHAYEVVFLHPTTHKEIRILASMPLDMQQACKTLFGNTACEYLS